MRPRTRKSLFSQFSHWTLLFSFLAESKFARPWLTLNDNRLTEKFLRHASRVANELGVTDEVAAFDAAAKAFPNPPPVVAATCVILHSTILHFFPLYSCRFDTDDSLNLIPPLIYLTT